MSLFDKFFGKKSHHESGALDKKASKEDIIDRVNALSDAVAELSQHVDSNHSGSVTGVGVAHVDIENSDLPEHQPLKTDDWKKLQQAGTISPPVPGALPVDPSIPTQQNVPTPLPGGPVPTPSEVAQAQLDVANNPDPTKSVTQQQAEALSNAQGNTPNA
jgi:hypothetical protein